MLGARGTLRVLALTIAFCTALAPAAARASSIFFIRSGEIWVANPDGSGAQQVTSDGGNGMPYLWVSAAKGTSNTLAFLRDNPAATPRQVFGTMSPSGTGAVQNPDNANMQPSGLYDGMMVSIDGSGDRIAWPKSYDYCFPITCNSYYAPYSEGVDGSNQQHVTVGQAIHVTFGDPTGQTLLFENIGSESASFGGLPAGCGSSNQQQNYLIIRQTPAPTGGTPGTPSFYCVNGIDLTDPALRPDGQAFAAIESTGSGTNTLVTIPFSAAASDTADSPATPVTSAASAAAPDFSPDGSQIAFEAANSTIDTVPAAGGAPTQILTNATSPAWSPYSLPTAGSGSGGGTGNGGGSGGGGGAGSGGGASGCGSSGQLASLARSVALQFVHALRGRLHGLTKAIGLTGVYGARVDVAVYLPPAHRSARAHGSAKLGTLLAIDIESFSKSGRATVRLVLTKAGRRLLAHPRRTRLTVLVLLLDAHGHSVERTSAIVLR